MRTIIINVAIGVAVAVAFAGIRVFLFSRDISVPHAEILMLTAILVGLAIMFSVNVRPADRRQALALALISPIIMLVLQSAFQPVPDSTYNGVTTWLFAFAGLASVAVAIGHVVLLIFRLMMPAPANPSKSTES